MNEITFYNVDFYKDYENVIDFDNPAARSAYFTAHQIAGLETEDIQIVKPPYQYVKVKGNYNEFQSVNYCLFSLDIQSDNGDTVTRNYYCFVDKVDYAGVGVVGLALTLDVWQSALFSTTGAAGFEIQECFVERAHINYYMRDDEIQRPDTTYLDVAEDIDPGKDKVFQFVSEPGITYSDDTDPVLRDVVFLIINYSSADVSNALLSFDGSNKPSIMGGNFGGSNPIQTAVIPVCSSFLNTTKTVYLETFVNGAWSREEKPVLSWSELFRIGDNPGVLIGKTGIASIYIEKQLPGQFYMYTEGDNVIIRIPADVVGQVRYRVAGSNMPEAKTVFFYPFESAVRGGQLTLQEINNADTICSPWVNSQSPPENWDPSQPWTVEKKAYCYPYSYPFLCMDRGFEYVIKPQFYPSVLQQGAATIPTRFGVLPIIYVFACADFRKAGYFVAGYKGAAILNKDGNGLAQIPSPVNMRPEVMDMAVNNNQTDVPLISDALVEYLQSKKASERAGLVVKGVESSLAIVGGAALTGASPATAALGGTLSLASNVAQFLAHRRDLQDTPNTVRSPGNDYGFEFAANSSGLELFFAKPTLPRWKEIINYFERFGVAIKKSIKVNTKSRKLWNFVKTIGARVKSNLNSEYTEQLRKIFDNGVRIWHYGDGADWQGVGVFEESTGVTRWNGEIHE